MRLSHPTLPVRDLPWEHTASVPALRIPGAESGTSGMSGHESAGRIAGQQVKACGGNSSLQLVRPRSPSRRLVRVAVVEAEASDDGDNRHVGILHAA